MNYIIFWCDRYIKKGQNLLRPFDCDDTMRGNVVLAPLIYDMLSQLVDEFILESATTVTSQVASKNP